VFSNIVHEISKCTPVPVPDFDNTRQEPATLSGTHANSLTPQTKQATNDFDSINHQQSKMALLRKKHMDKVKQIKTILK
jgi:hypothetical protein